MSAPEMDPVQINDYVSCLDSGEPRDAGVDSPGSDANVPESGFRFVSAGKLVANLQPINWLVRDYLEADSLALMYGEPGHGKSFIVLDLAACIATGTEWHGLPVRQGAVFIIAGEGHNGISRRLKAWELASGVSLGDAPLFVSHTAASLSDPMSAESVKAKIEQLARSTGQVPALIVVDTVSRNLGAADENNSADMATFVRGLDAMRNHWGASVLMVHHSGKDAAKGARGSTVLRGAVDAEYRVAKDGAGVVCLKATKMKDAELPESKAFRLVGMKLPLVEEDLRDIWSAAPEIVPDYQPVTNSKATKKNFPTGKNQRKAMEVIRNLREKEPEGNRVNLDAWKDALVKEGLNRKRLSEVILGLEEKKYIEVSGCDVELVE